MVMDAAQLREKGDWVAELKTLLSIRPGTKRIVADRPKAKHRATKAAVKLLVKELPAGGLDTERMPDIRKVVFNAVERLVDEKVEKSKRGKSRLEALDKFRDVLAADFDKLAGPGVSAEWKVVFHEALRALRQEALEADYKDANTQPQRKEEIRRDMLGTEEGRMAMARDPALADDVLKKVNPDWLNQGGTGARVVQKLWQAGNYDLICSMIGRGVDTSLAAKVDPVPGGARKDRQNGDYSGFVQPLQHVIATRLRDVALLEADECAFADGHRDKLEAEACPGHAEHLAKQPAPACTGDANKHQTAIADTGCPKADKHEKLLANTGGDFGAERRKQADGARKIFAALGTEAVSITSWSAVEDSDMIAEFRKNPGTIWGFEDMRYPYVQAAHETPEGEQPLRMMELWETVEAVLDRFAFDDLLDKPDETIKKYVDAGAKTIRDGVAKGLPKYAAIAPQVDAFITAFERDATAFLKEMRQQMPQVAFASGKALNDKGKARMDGTLGEIAGMDSSKLMAGIACKAGLWWAKAEGKPVYYCLDGINMDDVTSYKKLKNAAIEEFIAGGGVEKQAKKHSEVITMVEVREILKNWDELKDTIVFVEKGKVLTPAEAEERVNGEDDGLGGKLLGWKQKMEAGNKSAGRTPAPPRENFTHDLNAIDPTLLARLAPGPDGDMDARDIVKKTSYLVRVARARPEIALKYIMSRCAVLVRYGLMPDALVSTAIALDQAGRDKAPATEIERLGGLLLAELDKCHALFKAPLKTALIVHPLLV